jgi:hypothetical protein
VILHSFGASDRRRRRSSPRSSGKKVVVLDASMPVVSRPPDSLVMVGPPSVVRE